MNYQAKKTLENCKSYLMNDSYAYVAELCKGDNGYMAMAYSGDRSYFIILRVDDNIDSLIMELHPGLHCAPSFRGTVGSYINSINSMYKSGNFRLSTNGSIHLHNHSSFSDCSISSETIGDMLDTLLKISDTFEKILDRLCNGAPLDDPEDYDPDKVIEKYKAKRNAAIAKDLMDSLNKDTDTAEDDEDDGTPGTSLEDFRRMLKIMRTRRPRHNFILDDDGDSSDIPDDDDDLPFGRPHLRHPLIRRLKPKDDASDDDGDISPFGIDDDGDDEDDEDDIGGDSVTLSREARSSFYDLLKLSSQTFLSDDDDDDNGDDYSSDEEDSDSDTANEADPEDE